MSDTVAKSFDFFLSYASADQELAHRANDLLTELGYKVCFQGQNFLLGERFTDAMNRAHLSSHKVLVLLTPSYFATSPYTAMEFDAALLDGKLLIFRFYNATIPPVAYTQVYQDFPDELCSSESLKLLRKAATLAPTNKNRQAKRIVFNNLPKHWKGEGGTGTLIGRDAELGRLTECLNDDQCSIVCVVADGGYGKSSLVRRWLDILSDSNYAGIQAGFAYSFYRQGWEGGSAVDTGPFFSECLCALQGISPDQLPPGKEDVLASKILDIVQTRRTLLVLDGLEPHQNPRGMPDECQIKDSNLHEFLEQIKTRMKMSGGLCVITSRIMPLELISPPDSRDTAEIRLSTLDLPSSVEALKAAGLSEDNPDLDIWAKRSGGHPLLIALLAPAIQSGKYDPSMFRTDQVISNNHLDDIPGTVRNVVASHLNLLGPEAKAVLYSTALFDRAVSYGELRKLLLDRASINVFTRPLRTRFGLSKRCSDKLFRAGVEVLSKAAMLTYQGPMQDSDRWLLEAHPLVQAGVRSDLEHNHPELWKRANWTVYRSLTKSVTVRTPDDKESLRILYSAVPHGVEAGRGKEAGWMYGYRCLRGFRAYSTNRGMIGDDVALISHYFEGNWEQLKENIGLNSYARVQAFVWAGALLTAVNRSDKGVDLMEKGLVQARETRNFVTAARTARNIGLLYAMRGDLKLGEQFLRSALKDLESRSTLLIRLIEWKIVNRDFQRMACTSMLASILHQQGRFAEAENTFERGEAIQAAATRFNKLRNLWCYRKVDMFYDQGRFDEAKEALALASIDPEEPQGWGEGVFVYTILKLARIRGAIREYDLQGVTPDPDILSDGVEACKELEEDQGFRMDWLLPISKVAIAGKARIQGTPERAVLSISQAETLISRSGNLLFRVEMLMEKTRIHLALEQPSAAWDTIQEAAELAQRFGYLSRKAEIENIIVLCQKARAA